MDWKKYEIRATRLNSELLVYIDERGNISHCIMSHSYKPRPYFLGTVLYDDVLKQYIANPF